MTITKFSQLELPQPLQQAIDDLGFTSMTAIQQLALPKTLAAEDIAAQGRTGTGKTAAFLITIINRLLTKPAMKGRKAHHPRALVIAPTRELVIQIAKDAAALLKHTDLRCHVVYGGVDYEKQQQAFSEGVDILVGTPGRLIDYNKKRCYSLEKCEVAVIDEADRMFDLGFIKDLRFMMRRLPRYDQRQALLFSAYIIPPGHGVGIRAHEQSAKDSCGVREYHCRWGRRVDVPYRDGGQVAATDSPVAPR